MNFVLDTYSESAHTLSLYFLSIVGFERHSVSFYLGLDFSISFMSLMLMRLAFAPVSSLRGTMVPLTCSDTIHLSSDTQFISESYFLFSSCFWWIFSVSIDHAHKELCLIHNMNKWWLLCFILWKTLLSEVVHAFAFCTLLSIRWALFRLMLWATSFTAEWICASLWYCFLTLPFHFVGNRANYWRVSTFSAFFTCESPRVQLSELTRMTNLDCTF